MEMTPRALVSGLVLALGALLAAQQPPPTFRVGTRTVPVYATVTADDGRLVADLQRGDFEIYDNDQRQEVTVFESGVQPIAVVMLLDRSGSMTGNFELVQKAAEEFVQRLLASDKARIGSFSNRIQVDPREFTSDQEVLLDILRRDLQDPGPTPLWNAISVGMTALLHQETRRVVLVFTDGADAPGNFSNMNVTEKDAIQRAQREDVMVYAIGLSGWAPTRGRMGGGTGRGGWGRPPGGGPPPPPPGGPGGSGGVMQKPDAGLAKIAAESGGGYFELESTANMGTTFARVADELHRQYALGFSPQKLDGKTHKLDVRVTRPGMTVRARKSYYAAQERKRTPTQ